MFWTLVIRKSRVIEFIAASFFLTHCRAINAMVLLVRMLPIVPAGWDLSSSAFAVRHVYYAAGMRPGAHHIDRIYAICFLGPHRCSSSIRRLCSS